MLELNRVYQMDCRDGLAKLDDKSVDHIFTDPPYNVNKTTWDMGVLDLLDETAKECARIIKDDGLMCWFVPTRHLIKIGFLVSQYIPYRWTFIWNTPNNMLTGDLGFSKFTAILIFSRAKSVHKNMQDLKSINWKPIKSGHPTPKPKVLIQYLIKKISEEKQIILDPFMGSGTTAVVCKELNRQYIGFEKDTTYMSICEDRLRQESLSNFLVASLDDKTTK